MQIFGSAVLPFTTANQGIITQGVATFLNSGVTASQIVLTVENTIAGVRHTPNCRVNSQIMGFSNSAGLSETNFDGICEHFLHGTKAKCHFGTFGVHAGSLQKWNQSVAYKTSSIEKLCC